MDRTKLRPKIAIICGSGLGSLADELTDFDAFPYEDIPDFPVSTVEGHAGKMIFGYLGGVPVMCMQGRFHYYEGYPLAKVRICINIIFLHGPKTAIVLRIVLDANPRHETGRLHPFDSN